jgi:hypothetical protein
MNPASLDIRVEASSGVVPSSLTQSQDAADDLPPVAQFPVIATVTATFHEAGRLQPLPFPDVDD